MKKLRPYNGQNTVGPPFCVFSSVSLLIGCTEMIAFLLVKVNTGEEAIYSQREKKISEKYFHGPVHRVKNKIDTI